MSITKPYTFQPNTKARANEVNANFDTLYSQANTNISNIEANARDIDELNDTKAELNGNSSQRFAAANPINDTDVVNKQSLIKYITNSMDYINGLVITKDTNSPNDTIIVSAGSCYDSGRTVILSLSGNTSKQNVNQGANTTYNVYIIGNDTGTSTDVLISLSTVEPALPSGYTKYRLIGNFVTKNNNTIKIINSNSNSNPYTIETYINGYSWYRIYSDGWIEQGGLVKVAMRPGTTTVKLLKKYSDTNFTVLLGNNSSAESNPFVDSKTVSTIVLSRSYTGQQAVDGNSYWYTCGY